MFLPEDSRFQDRLNDFLLGLVIVADGKREWERERAERLREENAARALRPEQERRRAEETARIKALEEHAARWATSEQLLAFLAALKVEIDQQPGGAETNETRDRWIAWATEYAANLNPIRGRTDEVWTARRSTASAAQ